MRTVKLKLDKLTLDPVNARTHDKRNIEAIKTSLEKFGQQKPIVVDADNVVRAGNGTLIAARELGWETISVVRTTLAEAEALAYAIADNRTAELAAWDAEALVAAMASIKDPELRGAAGFTAREMDALAMSVRGPVEEDEVPEPPKKPVTKPGDVWTLGKHRVVCGDCRDVDAYPEENADLCLADPPYGVGVDYTGHDDTLSALRELALAFFGVMRPRCTVAAISTGVTQQWLYPEPDWVLCWFYGGGQHRSPWGFNCWQPVVVYGKDPKLAKGMGARPDAVNMNTPANAAAIDHPCPKPLPMWCWFMERCSNAHALVVDPFLGSGTTLVACEQLDRVCYGIEIEPRYVDVTVERWQNLTGKKAKRGKQA